MTNDAAYGLRGHKGRLNPAVLDKRVEPPFNPAIARANDWLKLIYDDLDGKSTRAV